MGKVNKLNISFRVPNSGPVAKFCGILWRCEHFLDRKSDLELTADSKPQDENFIVKNILKSN